MSQNRLVEKVQQWDNVTAAFYSYAGKQWYIQKGFDGSFECGYMNHGVSYQSNMPNAVVEAFISDNKSVIVMSTSDEIKATKKDYIKSTATKIKEEVKKDNVVVNLVGNFDVIRTTQEGSPTQIYVMVEEWLDSERIKTGYRATVSVKGNCDITRLDYTGSGIGGRKPRGKVTMCTKVKSYDEFIHYIKEI